MKATIRVVSLVLLALAFAGCDKGDNTNTPAPTAPPKPTASNDMGAAAEKAAGDAQKAAADAKHEADAAASNAADAGASAMAAVETQAKGLLEQAQNYIKENKLDLAEKAVTQLDALKSKLPAEWASKIDNVKSMLETAKKGAAALPSLPGGK